MDVSRRSVLASPVAAAARQPPLPQVPFGRGMVSRLIAEGNPVSGFSRQSRALHEEMRDDFDAANVKKLLAACEQAGINTRQCRADRHILRLLREYRNEGGRIQWIAQTASEMADFARSVREAAAVRPPRHRPARRADQPSVARASPRRHRRADPPDPGRRRAGRPGHPHPGGHRLVRGTT